MPGSTEARQVEPDAPNDTEARGVSAQQASGGRTPAAVETDQD